MNQFNSLTCAGGYYKVKKSTIKKDDLEIVVEEQDEEILESIHQLFDEEVLVQLSQASLKTSTQRRFDENLSEQDERMLTAYTTPMKISSSQGNSSSSKKRSPFQDITHKFDESSSKKSNSNQKLYLYHTPGKDSSLNILKFR